MLFGHNTDVKVGDAVYHVQTEDRGAANALIDSTVYCRGRVLHRRTNNYIDLMPLNAAHEDLLRKRIDNQHRAVIEEIRSGALKLIAPPAPAKSDGVAQKPVASPVNHAPAAPAATPPLTIELLNARNWLSGKRANLQVVVRQKQNGIAVAGANVAAHIEGSADARRHSAVTGANGHAELEFDVPQLPATESALVIEATQANAKGHLRFQLRAKARVPTA